jgi:mannose-6-phosphate isomerase-like protein (cupin superfamily)
VTGLPGAVSISELRVYPWPTPDGRRGGSPHLHLVCTEAYAVLEGEGAVQTLTAAEGFRETPLRPGDVMWFSPGTIHRLVNGDGRLRLHVIMQNDGLPEAGDAVLTYPAEHLADRAAYDAVTSLLDEHGAPSPDRARARRDLAIEGFAALRRAAERGDPGPLRAFHAAAGRLVVDRLDAWRARWAATARAATDRTGAQLDALGRDDHDHLSQARTGRIPRPQPQTLGMCGFLNRYQTSGHQG